jgi:hypothetical protein
LWHQGPSVIADQRLGFRWTPRAGLIAIDRRDVVNDRVNNTPLRINDIVAREKFTHAADRVTQQMLLNRFEAGHGAAELVKARGLHIRRDSVRAGPARSAQAIS